jgi:hypothetical protein
LFRGGGAPPPPPPPPPEANVKDNGFPWSHPGLLEILRKTQFLCYYSVPEYN